MTIMPALLGSPEVQLLPKLGIRAREPVPSFSFSFSGYFYLVGIRKSTFKYVQNQPIIVLQFPRWNYEHFSR